MPCIEVDAPTSRREGDMDLVAAYNMRKLDCKK